MTEKGGAASSTDSKQLFSLEKVLPLTVLAGSALYFTGSEYLDAKAMGLGLASAPGEPSLHKTMAFGASVIFQPSSIFGLMIFAAVSLLLIIIILAIVKKWVLPSETSEKLYRMAEGTDEKVRRFRDRAEELRAAAEAEDPSQIDADAIMRDVNDLETEVDAEIDKFDKLKKQTSWRLRLSSALLTFAKAAPAGVFFGLVINYGSEAGEAAAADIRSAIVSGCTECLTFSSGDTQVTGLAAFQSGDTVVVASEGGLAILPAGEPIISQARNQLGSEQEVESVSGSTEEAEAEPVETANDPTEEES